MKTIYEAANGVEAHMVLDLLTQEGLSGRVDGEYLQGAAGGLPAAGLVRVLVAEADTEAAMQVINRWNAAQPAEQPSNVSVKPRWPFLLAGLALGIAATYAFMRVPAYETGIDHNRDGLLDEKWVYSAGRILVRYEIDRNLDGKVDAITRYDAAGLPERTESDDNFDGVFETTTVYRLHNAQTSTADTDGDGFADLRTNYTFGVVSSVEYLHPKTGKNLKVEYLQLGKVVTSEIDTDGDGKMDQRTTYDKVGEPVKTEPI